MNTFGIFSALCIGLLYLLNVLLMPPTLVIRAKYLGGVERTTARGDHPEQRWKEEK